MEASTLKPAEVAVYFLKAGIAKHHDRYESVFFKAVLAGIMLSFGGLLSEVVSGGAPALTLTNPGIVKILGGFVFPVGLVMIVLQGQELLTSNMMVQSRWNLVFPMAVMKRVVPWWSLPLNFLIVTFGNLVGSLFFGAILVKYSGVMSADPYDSYVRSFAIKKAAEPEWHQIFLRGIGCNWLVCVAVWQAAGSRETVSKVIAIWLPIWTFVACSFDHVVANMFSVPLGIMFGADLTVAEYIRKSLIASYLGNIVGALLVALPATYFYLWDYDAGGLRNAEAGVVDRRDATPIDDIDEKRR
ncbi:Formate/nitrite transporter [Mycena venus]|uniref:Formate/nitrite transporter n=1 Tax=Mycena venus TaxID=2733690 RepID=A0A8H6YMN0_9AGAR|nr:Formate/nitrite transporter [Mycena venus]